MTSLALVAANIHIGELSPRQREALIEILVNGPLLRRARGPWLSRLSGTWFDPRAIRALNTHGLIKITADERGNQHGPCGTWNCFWARLTTSGTYQARASLQAWVAAADRLVEDAARIGIAPEDLERMAEKLAHLPEWEEEGT